MSDVVTRASQQTIVSRRIRPREFELLAMAALLGFTLLSGCRSDRVSPKLTGPAIPLADAAGIVNANLAKVRGTLRANGSVDAKVTMPSGSRRSLSLDGVLFFLEPRFLRLDLKSFGERQMLLGSNLAEYWVYDREEDSYQCGKHGDRGALPGGIRIRPSQLIDALGLTPIPVQAVSPDGVRRVQRIDGEYQQILFLDRDTQGQLGLQKEYWLDRNEPRLIRRVVFRDAEGQLEMDAWLDDYVVSDAGGAMLPRTLRARWPREGAEINFKFTKWTIEPSVKADGIQFATPRECRNVNLPRVDERQERDE